MLKGEVEFLNYYLNDLKPRVAQRNKQAQKLVKRNFHVWTEEETLELVEKCKETRENGKIFFTMQEYLEDVKATYPEDHWITADKIRSRVAHIGKWKRKNMRLMSGEDELYELYYEMMGKIKATSYKPKKPPKFIPKRFIR